MSATAGNTIEKGRRMYNRFMSAARPVSGFNPPNPKSNTIAKLVGKIVIGDAVFACAASTALAQAGTTITGTVTNEHGGALPGATVMIQGTPNRAQAEDVG